MESIHRLELDQPNAPGKLFQQFRRPNVIFLDIAAALAHHLPRFELLPIGRTLRLGKIGGIFGERHACATDQKNENRGHCRDGELLHSRRLHFNLPFFGHDTKDPLPQAARPGGHADRRGKMADQAGLFRQSE
ncbi:hypothetical protein SDC9_195132 [bioreactor metagenome]|uniref:Uncharacterized protein n=1 Tax=bioreactor metagenome TaxID=1076179 RepID=A0A645IAQ4_9ZZZZ